MSKQKHIQFQLAGITTHEFATFENNLSETLEGKFAASVNFAIDDESKFLECLARFEIHLEEPILIIEVACDFEIEEEAWETFLNTKKTVLTIPKGFAQHLAVITVGTTRGVLHAKTDNTPFNKYFLPQVNVTQLVEEKLIFDLG